MPWTAKRDPELCSVSEPWAVVKLDDGSVAGCHGTQADAEKQVAALYAQEGGRPGEYGSQTDPPEEAGMSSNSNPANVTVNVTYPGFYTTSTATDVRGANPWIFRQDPSPPPADNAAPDEEAVEDAPEDVPEDDDAEVTGEGGPEDPSAESDPEGAEEDPDPEVVEEEEEAEEVELKDDPEAARSRVHHVPYAFRPVTRSVTNDCRGLPEQVLERLAAQHEDVGVVDRVGRGACELRFRPELRFNPDGTLFLHGYATVYDFPYDVAGGPPFGWSETIVRDACRVSVQQGADVRLLINHDGIPLARTKSGTLRLESDDLGLYNQAPSLDPRSPTVQSLLSALSRGDMDEMSFAFKVKEQEWNDDYTERHITEVMLFDVSVVTYPANPAAMSSTKREGAPTTYPGFLAQAELELLRTRGRARRREGSPGR